MLDHADDYKMIEDARKNDMKVQKQRNRDHLDELFDANLTKHDGKTSVMRNDFSNFFVIKQQHIQNTCKTMLITSTLIAIY